MILGGPGTGDFVSYASRSDGVDGLNGNDIGTALTIEGRGAGYNITGGEGNDTLNGLLRRLFVRGTARELRSSREVPVAQRTAMCRHA
jgi:hypothetical protein